ncbi:MAG TPA: hypothetical protein VLJ15_01270 [Gammaproteobacteria bacterium]|nr:hypothetical protein [Gammaproteobacteria bacterium]
MSSPRIKEALKAQGCAKRGKGKTITTRAGREVNSPKECDCGVTSEDERDLDQDIKDLARYEREKAASPGGSSLWGRASSSDIVPVLNFEAPMSPRGKRLRDAMREKSSYVSPSKTVVTHRTPQGSPDERQTTTPRKRDFVRSFKAWLVIPDEKGNIQKKEIEVAFFQTADSAKRCKKVSSVSPEDVKKVEASCLLPDSPTYEIDHDAVTADRLKHIDQIKRAISPRHKKLKATAIAACHGLPVVGRAYEHSHLQAYCHGQTPAVGSSPGTGSKPPRTCITIPALREHNSMRLVSAEIPEVGECINILGKLFYSDKATLLLDEQDRPIPVIGCEEVIWADESGTEVHLKYDAMNDVTPAKQLRDVSAVLYQEAFFPPSKLSFDGPEFEIASSDSEAEPAKRLKTGP